MSFDSEHFRRAIGLSDEPWTARDATELALLLQNPTIIKAFAFLDAEARNRVFAMVSLDLTSPEGIAVATKTQGFSGGIQRAIDLLCELTEETADGPGSDESDPAS